MTVSAAYVVAPVFTAPEVVALFFACVTGKTGFRNYFGRLVFERDDLGRVAFLRVSLTWAVACLAARYLVFPTVDAREASVGCMREGFELILVTVFAGVAADVIVVR